MNLNLDRKRSDFVRGVAILALLIGHGTTIFTDISFGTINWGGAIAVTSFLFLSGYGLYVSYLKGHKIDTKAYWMNRIRKVMIPFWFVMLIDSITYILPEGMPFHASISMGEWLRSIVGYVDYIRYNVIDSTMWFITFILMWYILFYVLFIVKIPDQIRLVILFTVSSVIAFTDIGATPDWKNCPYAFSVGVLAGVLKDKTRCEHNLVISLMSASALIASSIVYIPRFASVQLQIYGFAGLILAICVSDFIRSEGLIYRLLIGLGTASYWIYLTEGMMISRLPALFIFENGLINALCYALLSIATGLLFHFCACNVKRNT